MESRSVCRVVMTWFSHMERIDENDMIIMYALTFFYLDSFCFFI